MVGGKDGWQQMMGPVVGGYVKKFKIFFVPNELKSQKKQHPNFSFYLNLGGGWVKPKYGYFFFNPETTGPYKPVCGLE